MQISMNSGPMPIPGLYMGSYGGEHSIELKMPLRGRSERYNPDDVASIELGGSSGSFARCTGGDDAVS